MKYKDVAIGLSPGETPYRYPTIYVLRSAIMINRLRMFLGKT